VGFVRILTKSTLVLVTEVLRLVLPIRSHPINPIRSSPAGGGSGFFPGTGGTHRGTVQNPGALRGRLGAGVVAYVPLIRALVTLSRAPRETALFPVHCSRCIVPTASLPGGIRRPHILRSVEEPRVICRVFSRGPGRRIPDRLTMSRYVAPPARVIPGCAGHFFQSIGLHPGRVGA
jgi:hypothetical protein